MRRAGNPPKPGVGRECGQGLQVSPSRSWVRVPPALLKSCVRGCSSADRARVSSTPRRGRRRLLSPSSERSAAWSAHLLRMQGVAGSNPAAPTGSLWYGVANAEGTTLDPEPLPSGLQVRILPGGPSPSVAELADAPGWAEGILEALFVSSLLSPLPFNAFTPSPPGYRGEGTEDPVGS